jgi:hypothetical protein
MMAVELCRASPAFTHPCTNEERDHAHGLNDEATKSFGQSTRGNDLRNRA